MVKEKKTNVSASQNHDIKSRVMSIKAYSQLLLKKTRQSLDSQTFDYLVRLDGQIDKLIDDLNQLDTHER